jgi:tripartite-type tricarboxylate transporter receptor subunit TctC
MTRILQFLIVLVGAFALPVHASGTYPDKPVRLVVPFPPGGGTDAFARILGAELAKTWGQQVIVENRAGAQGNIGTLHAVKAPPDGYTLIFAHQGVLTINSHIYPRIGFDPLADLVPVSRGSEQPFVLVVNPAVPANTLKELTELAKKQPGTLTFASSSSGPQLAGELYKISSGTSMVHVPYKGAGPAVVDLLAGHVNMMFANAASVAQHVQSGRLRALVVFGKTRIDALPDVPTAMEAGYPALGENPEWYGIAVPVGTPSTIVGKLNTDIVAALKTSPVQKSLRALGMIPSPSTPEAFADQIRADHITWGKVVRQAGVKAD